MTPWKPRISRAWDGRTGRFVWSCTYPTRTGFIGPGADAYQLHRRAAAFCARLNAKTTGSAA